MAQTFPETAHNNIDRENFEEGYERIQWNNKKPLKENKLSAYSTKERLALCEKYLKELLDAIEDREIDPIDLNTTSNARHYFKTFY